MNQPQHEALALQLLGLLPLVRGRDAANPGVRGALRKLSPDSVERQQFKQYASAPDRIRDVVLKMPLFIPDIAEFLHHNLSSFQHFVVEDENEYRGYRWQDDSSLGALDAVGEAGMGLLHVHVSYDIAAATDGFTKEVLADSPMAQHLQGIGPAPLGDFCFPSASAMATYFGGRVTRAFAERDDFSSWAKTAGFVLHFVMDACCPHHVWGYLLSGHASWEDALEREWSASYQDLKTAPARWLESVAAEVKPLVERLDKSNVLSSGSLQDIVETAATSTRIWLNRGKNAEKARAGRIDATGAREVCVRALAHSVKAFELMAKPLRF